VNVQGALAEESFRAIAELLGISVSGTSGTPIVEINPDAETLFALFTFLWSIEEDWIVTQARASKRWAVIGLSDLDLTLYGGPQETVETLACARLDEAWAAWAKETRLEEFLYKPAVNPGRVPFEPEERGVVAAWTALYGGGRITN